MTNWKKTILFTLGFLAAAVAAIQLNHMERAEVTAKEETAVFSGIDLSCADCQEQIEDALANIIGIVDYSVDPAKRTVTVTFDTEEMEAEWIKKSLEAVGFPPEDMEIVEGR
ncbi:hypothetical protein BSNK01_09130 [Bacillaceae bacterium]